MNLNGEKTCDVRAHRDIGNDVQQSVEPVWLAVWYSLIRIFRPFGKLRQKIMGEKWPHPFSCIFV